jgi:hypothetical protein
MKNFTSPKGIAGFTSLTRPDTKYDADGVYHTKLTFPSLESVEGLIELMKEEALEELGKAKAAKVKFPEENEDGTVTIKFKSKAKDKNGNTKKLPLFDGRGNPIKNTEDLSIGGGSVLKIKGAAKGYANGTNIGVTLYINSVQIIKLEEYGGGGFDADDEAEFVADEAPARSPKKSEEVEEDEDQDVNF